MTISPKCHIGELVSVKASDIIKELENDCCGKGPWYAITTALESRETLYVLSNKELGSHLYDKGKLRVLGIAGSRREAFALITEMVQEASDKERLSDLKQFFMEY